MIWFLSDIRRLDRERAEIGKLEAGRDSWLKNVSWRLTPTSTLEVDADIVISDASFPVTLKYPYAFPSCPPSVFPRNVKRRWSFHQYGKGGELCLEWGPDNWHPDITGADLLVSAHKLLSLENPASAMEDEVIIPSRDAPTIAQTLRRETHRFVATAALIERLALLASGHTGEIAVSLGNIQTSLAVVLSLQEDGSPIWSDSGVPSAALDALEHRGFAIRLSREVPDLSDFPSKRSLFEWLLEEGIDLGSRTEGSGQAPFVLLSPPAGLPRLIWLFKDADDGFLVFSTICPDADARSRLPGEYGKLAGKKVCIVGCGSVGSKVATSLCRAGVGAFELIDDELFTLENLVRNELDWRDIGSHKVDALARKLALVNPRANITRRKVRLNGQEASSRIAGALRAASSCDLIIDATASPSVFNLVSAVAVADRRPLIWGEVFAGGIGGLIVRYTPQHMPTPPTMRRAITQWCDDRGVPWRGTYAGYDGMTEDGEPLLAADADVAVIAAHISRMALDVLLEHDPFEYTWPVYFIGLKPGWIFNGPLDAFPIDIPRNDDEVPATADLPAGRIEENALFLVGLMENLSHETSSSC